MLFAYGAVQGGTAVLVVIAGITVSSAGALAWWESHIRHHLEGLTNEERHVLAWEAPTVDMEDAFSNHTVGAGFFRTFGSASERQQARHNREDARRSWTYRTRNSAASPL